VRAIALGLTVLTGFSGLVCEVAPWLAEQPS